MAERWRFSRVPGHTAIWHVDDAAPGTAGGGTDGPPGDVERQGSMLATLDGDGRVWLWIDGRTLIVEPATATREGMPRHAVHDTLSSPMPATVVRVEVAPGDRVAQGDTLLLLEAMKMEVPLRAPHAGVVTAVRCASGDLVQPGTPLVELEEDAPDDRP